MAEERLHNDGKRPMSVPGFDNLPIYLELHPEERFAHGSGEWAQWPNLTARELAMLQVMNRLTDKSNWHVKILDYGTISEWREEALSVPLMSEKAWDWCLAELQDKAKVFQETGCVLVFNTGSGICKSDTLITVDLRAELKDGIAPLLVVPEVQRDWYSGSMLPAKKSEHYPDMIRRHAHLSSTRHRAAVASSSIYGQSQSQYKSKIPQQVLNLVHPSLYPLVYGKTRVLAEGGEVSLGEFLKSCGKGDVAPAHGEDYLDNRRVDAQENLRPANPFWTYRTGVLTRFSRRFQWLPCEVKFTEKQKCGVQITSYINNLHPSHFKSLYGAIEKLISLVIEPWNSILIKGGRGAGGGYGRWPTRIKTWGVEWKPEWPIQTRRCGTKTTTQWKCEYPEWWRTPQEMINLEDDRESEAFQAMVQKIKEFLLVPDYHPEEHTLSEEELEFQTEYPSKKIPEDWWTKDEGLLEALWAKWLRLYHWEHPEPGKSFSYEEWKLGQTRNAIVKRVDLEHRNKIAYDGDQDHEFYSVSLQETFQDQGLQVITKLSSIELTPENPSYAGGNWQNQSTLNEHIIATAVYYYDVENVTDSRLSFRQSTKMSDKELNIGNGHGTLDSLYKVFAIPIPEDGTHPDAPDVSDWGLPMGPSVQELGSVSTPEGRLLAWPNTLAHRVEPFDLVDKSKPGYRRFIALYLVDPNYRICSTRNVPPQQHDWWAEEALAQAGLAEKGMPEEIIEAIGKKTCDWPMGADEAKSLRLEMDAERLEKEDYVLFGASEQWNFCEV